MKLLFLGDFFYDYDVIAKDIEEIAEWIATNKYAVIINLEGSLSKSGNKIRKRGPNLCQSIKTISVLKKLNVVGVCLANNHVMDYGDKGLFETIRLLEENNIQHVGAGKNISESLKPMQFELCGQHIIIQNFGWDVEETVYATKISAGCAPREEEVILYQTAKIRETYPDAIIINVYHWGFEYNLLPMPWDINLAHKSIESGCDLIVGHHPHILQASEVYKGKEIYYSIGNFYFASKREDFNNRFTEAIQNLCDYGAALSFDVKKRLIDNKYIVYYDSLKKSTRILLNYETFIKDISGVDFNSLEYIRKVKEGSFNINPILTLNEYDNQYKIKKLKRDYLIARCFSVIRKISFGEMFYQGIKKLYKLINR
ncbi:CapA family protein [Phosphitispora sp. TUW77]|uniref:CapA family protein n=1 Tax=Phosphitispora sp. TUW77 TaxID=3152361 RepID=UPI003AB76333